MKNELLALGEYAAAGLYEEPNRSLFYRKALGIRRFYETCELAKYNGEYLYPSGSIVQKMDIIPDYYNGLSFETSAFTEKAPQLSKKMIGEFCVYRSTVPVEHTVAGNMYTHSVPNYERILKESICI